MEKGEELSRAKYSESSIDHDGGQNMLNKFSSSNVTSKKKKKKMKRSMNSFCVIPVFCHLFAKRKGKYRKSEKNPRRILGLRKGTERDLIYDDSSHYSLLHKLIQLHHHSGFCTLKFPLKSWFRPLLLWLETSLTVQNKGVYIYIFYYYFLIVICSCAAIIICL